MTDVHAHLSEEERHSLADGSLDPERRAELEAHVRDCDACAGDVARIVTLMKRIADDKVEAPDASLGELWPSIRAKIEQTKVVPLAPVFVAPVRARRAPRRLAWIGVLAAAVLIAIVTFRGRTVAPATDVVATNDDTSVSLIAVVDSVHAYEQEAQTLLNRLELQRAMLRPEAAALLDRNLRSVDVAIAELKEAIARDPNNRALRQLLASSYRQKVDLLKRVANAG
jgi:hypothetical protein